MPQMPVRQHLAPTLGQELQTLEADQGPRLEQIIWRLGIQAQRVPGDLDTAVAYVHALTLSGQVAAARAEVLRLLALLHHEGDAASTSMLLNAAGASVDAGLPAHAMTCVERVLSRDVERNPAVPAWMSVLTRATAIAVRFGELEWYARHLPLADTVPMMLMRAIYGQGLNTWWPAQQRAIDATLGEHVASTIFGVQDFKDGTSRITLDYYTDLQSHSEIGELHNAVLDAVSAVYTAHPEGPGAFLGKVLIDLHGPEIPLRELAP